MSNKKPSYEELQKRIKELEDAGIKCRKQADEMQWLFKSMLNAFVIFESVFDEAENFVSCRFEYINDSFEKIIGVKNNEVKGKTIHEVWPQTEQSWVEKYGHVALTGQTLVFENYHHLTQKTYHCRAYRPWETTKRFCVIFDDITDKEEHQQNLEKIEWMLKPRFDKPGLPEPEYGDLSALNHQGLILQNVGKTMLTDIVRDYLDLLDTSAAVYEANGDYALGIFSSDWCNLLDNASRNLCGNCSNKEALASKKWLCHESCWADASKLAIDTGEPADIECKGGLHIYALPIKFNKQIIGAINFGYGNPPGDKTTLEDISAKYQLPLEELSKKAAQYEARPAFIIDIAKARLQKSARMISEIVGLRLAEKKIQYQNEEIDSQNEELTSQNEEIWSSNLNLRKSEEKLQRLFDNMSSGFAYHKIVLDENEQPVDYIFMEINAAFEKMTGLKAKDIIGKKVTQVIPGLENDPADWIDTYGEVALSGHPATFHNYGMQIGKWFSVTAFSPEKGFFATIFEDITQWKLAEEKVKDSDAKYRSYINNAPHGILVVDDQGRYLDANPKAAQMTGYSIQEILQMKTTDFAISKEEREIAKKRFLQLPRNGKLNATTRFVKKDGSIGWWQIDAVKIAKNKFLGFQTDITAEKIAEENLIKALQKAEESDRLKSAFLANMSHEIRTPMNGILGFAELLKEPELTGDEQKKYVGIIEKSGQRMLNIINDVIDMSKIEAGQMEVKISEINIREQAEYLCTFFSPEIQKKGLKLITNFPATITRTIVKTDREKLYAIITNLLKNAIKYTNAGKIEFGYALKKDTEPVLTEQGKSAEVQFYIRDTGIGIPASRQLAVFERFVQADIEDTKALEGAGLGLAITKAYVEMLGGEIWLESLEGSGSTFYFTIPDQSQAIQNAKPETIEKEDKEGTKNRKLKILVAEDDVDSRLHLSIVLAPLATEIIYAKTGTTAVNLCNQNPDLDLVLMDIKMPEMNGYEATRKIRAFNKEVIIIAQTAYALSGDREKALKAGCNDYIAKPIKLDALKGLISKYSFL